MNLTEHLRADREARQTAAHTRAENFQLRDKVKRALRSEGTARAVVSIPWYQRAVFSPIHAFAFVVLFSVAVIFLVRQQKIDADIHAHLVPVEFSYFAPDAKTVEIAGDFAEWNHKKLQLNKTEDGHWRLKLHLPSGRYQYQFVVDGVWTIDPRCPARVADDFGKENSLLVL